MKPRTSADNGLPLPLLLFNRVSRLPLACELRSLAGIAADAGEPVMMKHLLQSAQIEYLKLGMMLTDVETRGWV